MFCCVRQKRVKKMMSKRIERGTRRVRKMKRIVRKTTPKKRAVWTRTLMKMSRRKTISEEREIMGLLECD